jgi:hypothetical protein
VRALYGSTGSLKVWIEDDDDGGVATIERLEGEGWQAESSAEYGFVFIRREPERRLLMLTPRNPYSTAPQSFDPFRLQRIAVTDSDSPVPTHFDHRVRAVLRQI